MPANGAPERSRGRGIGHTALPTRVVDLWRVVVVAGLYAFFGWLGLRLAVPPGYATLIWPASGIAVSALLLFGQRLWPGVFVGSFAVNAVVGEALGVDGPNWTAFAVAVSIAAGSTLQSILAVHLVRRRFGLPLVIDTMRAIVLFLLLAALLPCLIGASVGVASLLGAGVTPLSTAANNWITWWIGDVAGILIVLPLTLISPWRPWSARFRGKPLARVSRMGLLALLVPLGLTFYGWKFTSEASFEKGLSSFEVLARDNERALLNRLDAYNQSLDAGAGAFNGSFQVSAAEWRVFVDEFDIDRNLPGINGIGFIQPVKPDDLQSLLKEVARNGVSDFTVKPRRVTDRDMFVITYIEPLKANEAALGLDIAFEGNRRAAAIHARDTGRPTITHRIFLVQDKTKSAGFLLLRPLYEPFAAVGTVEERRAAFRGWVYAPFVANNFMRELTASQGKRINISVYDGPKADADMLIYTSSDDTSHQPAYRISKVLSVREQQWTVVWESTPAFAASISSKESAIVLAAGLSLTLLFGVLLMSHARREDEIQQTVERKTREIAARERQNRSIVDTALAGVVVLDENGTIRSANPATELIFGYDATELAGRPIATLMPGFQDGADIPEDAKNAAAELMETRTRSGDELFLTVQRNEWRTEAGNLRYTLIISDVTLQHRITKELEVSEQRLKQALEGARIGVFDIDLTTGRSFVSVTWKQMLGFSEDDEIEPQQQWESRLHPDDRARVKQADQDCIDGRSESSWSEYRLRHADGHWIWLRSEAIVIERDPTGRAMRMIGTQTDVSALKTAELALRDSEERFRLALENAPVGMALISDKGKWLQVNEALCSLLGYEPAEFERLDFATVTHPEELSANGDLSEFLERAAAEKQVERRFVAKNGRPIWCLFGLSRVEDQQAKHGYFVAQFQDIDARKEAERAKREFIATVSHELRTPLTSIRGSLGLVLGPAGKDLTPKIAHLLTIALKNCERLIELVNDILDIEKIASGEMKFDRRIENLNELVRQAVETNQPYFEKFGVTTVVEADGTYAVDVDARRLQQVFSNLLSNAAKFSPSGGTVDIFIVRRGGAVEVSVADEGAGIPPEFQDKIFNRFSQANSSATRNKGGTGLGLHISQQIVEHLDGKISYRNIPGSGAEFTVALPLCENGSDSNEPEDQKQSVAQKDTADLPRVLHVEGDADFFAMMSSLLRGRVKLMRAPTLAAARKQLSEQSFDLLILDETLPDGPGQELLDDALSQRADLRVMMLVNQDQLQVDVRAQNVVKSRLKEEELARMICDVAAR